MAGAAVLLSGCVSSPTYGTGKSSSKQLSEDLGSAFSPFPKKKPKIDYNPRPDIVKPDSATLQAEAAALPAPQDKIAAGNPAWPESPEQRRARIRDTATKNQNNPGFEPEITIDGPNGGISNSAAGGTENQTAAVTRLQREEFKRRKRENEQGSNTTRRYLSEPPLEYRVPAATAATDDLGEDESKKARRIKKENRKKGGKTSIKDLWPF